MILGKCNGVILRDGSIIKRKDGTFILKYVKGVGWKLYRVKRIKEMYEERK